MAAFPAVQAKIRDAVEAEGLNPDEVMRRLHEQAELELLGDEAPDEDAIPNNIYIIAQALAYRKATLSDFEEIHALLNGAYREEVEGKEAFRQGKAVSKDEVTALLADADYSWLVAEAPNGRGIEKDGVILGVCCYSTSGKSRRNGQDEGRLCSVRLFAVQARYHGLCIGRRLLTKLESSVLAEGCCRVLVCLPSIRLLVQAWIRRRGYEEVGGMGYPFKPLGHVPLEGFEGTKLMQFVLIHAVPRSQHAPVTSTVSNEADSKHPRKGAAYQGSTAIPRYMPRLVMQDVVIDGEDLGVD